MGACRLRVEVAELKAESAAAKSAAGQSQEGSGDVPAGSQEAPLQQQLDEARCVLPIQKLSHLVHRQCQPLAHLLKAPDVVSGATHLVPADVPVLVLMHTPHFLFQLLHCREHSFRHYGSF